MNPRSWLFRLALVSSLLSIGLLWPGLAAAGPSAPRTGLTPSNTCFIINLYGDLLGRRPSGAEVASGLLFLGSHSRDVYAAALLATDEYETDLVRGWYQKFLGRPATVGEVTGAIGLFDVGAKDEQIVASTILSSTEYFDQPRVGGTNTGFVKALYSDLLNRAPIATELNDWVNLLNSHAVTRLQVATDILTTTEYRAELIQGWYSRYQGRPANVSELSAAETILASPTGTDEQVIALVVGSAEYFAHSGLCHAYLPGVMR